MAINFKRLEEITRALKPISQNGRNFHTTFVYWGNKLLVIANNDYKKIHPYHVFGPYKPLKNETENYKAGIHSEISSLIKLGLEECSHLTFVNIRIDNDNMPAISKPCGNCSKVMNDIGFKTFWYHDGKTYTKSRQL